MTPRKPHATLRQSTRIATMRTGQGYSRRAVHWPSSVEVTMRPFGVDLEFFAKFYRAVEISLQNFHLTHPYARAPVDFPHILSC